MSSKEYMHEWHIANKEKVRTKNRQYRLANYSYLKRYMRKWRRANKEKIRIDNKRLFLKAKMDAFEAYGGCECKWCGDTDVLVLSLDHINNDGAKHRKASGNNSRGSAFYWWLKRNNYPKEFYLQVLCMSCNMAKKNNKGVLPENRKDLLRQNKIIIEARVFSLSEYCQIIAKQEVISDLQLLPSSVRSPQGLQPSCRGDH